MIMIKKKKVTMAPKPPMQTNQQLVQMTMRKTLKNQRKSIPARTPSLSKMNECLKKKVVVELSAPSSRQPQHLFVIELET